MRSLFYSAILGALTIVVISGVAESSVPPQFCAADHLFWCDNSDRCIPVTQICDGHRNCEEGEDEDHLMCLSRRCTAETAESLDKFYCASENKCIGQEWVCDGFPDCTSELTTAEDENADMCARRECDDDEFSCGDGECIKKNWQCDGQADCPDKSDETNCDDQCLATEFFCPPTANETGKCISERWICDKEPDCPGGEDEANCEKFKCPNGYFNCEDEEKCIPDRWKCDGDFDCHNKLDEQNCKVEATPQQDVLCTKFEFTCKSGAVPCILSSWKCDGTKDCSDGSDEDECEDATPHCTGGEFLCHADNRCIPGQLKCSGKWECSDGEDEHDCRKYCDIRKGSFTCDISNPFGATCISIDKVCDGNNDCGNNYDEDAQFCSDSAPQKRCHNNPCGTAHGVVCVDVFTRNAYPKSVDYYCKCNSSGYQFNSSDNTCADINECEESEGVCDQLCYNTPGSYKCECNADYTLAADGKTCRANGAHPRLLFSNRHQIRSMHFHQSSDHDEYLPLVDSKAAVAIDFDYLERRVFFSDMREQKIYFFDLPKDDAEEEPQATALDIDRVETPDGIAYDWVHKHLYWTDTASNTINMADVKNLKANEKPVERTVYQNEGDDLHCETRNRTVSESASICIDEPRALVLHPRKGWLFWSDWGTNPYIALAAMDGTYKEKLVHNTKSVTLLTWPNGLTLDQTTGDSEQLYWIDAKLNSLFSCSVRNCMGDAKLLAYDENNIRHPWSITVFESQLFWSDWHNQSIFSASKFTGENIQRVLTNLEQPMDLKVFHPVMQPTTINHCDGLSDDDACEHICAPKPWKKAQNNQTFWPPSIGKRHTCLCPRGYQLGSNGRNCSIIEIPQPVKLTTTNTPLMVKPHSRQQQPQNAPAVNVGTIAAIAASAVAAIIILIIVTVLLVLRKMKRNKSNNMNFENPIYKRTTEDKLELPRHEYQPSGSVPSAMVPLTAPESQASTSCVA